MLSDEAIEKIVERLVNRIEQGNEYILGKIGNTIDEIGKLKPSNAIELEQMFKYGGDYQKIVNQLAKITKLNKKEIEKIFKEVAKKDYQFAEKFYKYRNKKYIPYEENIALQNQVNAIAQLTNNKYIELARSKAIGVSVRNKKGKVVFKTLKTIYDEAIDTAILNVAQGKTTFQEEMYKFLKSIGISGIKTLDYNGRAMRLDSAFRMHMKDAIRQLHNVIDTEFGKEFDADGVEISVHLNPAPDHELVQGRQFSIEEFEKFQNDIDAVSYDGMKFPAEFKGHDRRSISQYNCYHKTFSIILGVSQPEYSNEELQEIIDNNNKGFEFEGKHYTNYEGTQLQRKIETEIRKQKDLQILGRTGGNEKLAQESQRKINILTRKYKKLSKESGLPTFAERMRVSDYRAIKVKDTKENIVDLSKYKVADESIINKMQNKSNKVFRFHSNEDELRDLKAYTSPYGYYKKVTKGLIENKGDINKMYPADGKIAQSMSNIMKNNKLEDDLILYRGTNSKFYKNLQIGDKFTMYNFPSTSVKEEIADKFVKSAISQDKEPIKLIIYAPKGTEALYVGDNALLWENEYELLLNKNLKYKIVNKTKDELYMEVMK